MSEPEDHVYSAVDGDVAPTVGYEGQYIKVKFSVANGARLELELTDDQARALLGKLTAALVD